MCRRTTEENLPAAKIADGRAAEGKDIGLKKTPVKSRWKLERGIAGKEGTRLRVITGA